MDEGKSQIFYERRVQRANTVSIMFIDPENFNILDDEGNLKYIGKIIQKEPHIDDYCTCPNFYHCNHDRYIAAHGTAYQCKHILAAKKIRFGEDPQVVI